MNLTPFRQVLGMTLGACMLSVQAPVASAQTDAPAADDNRSLFANFMHQAVVGRFDRADSYAQQLLANNPDPLDVLAFSDEHTNSVKTLILLVNNERISDSAKQILDLIREGELLLRQDPERIKGNIEKLGGDPLAEFNAINRLKESGEYAVPWLLDALADPGRSRLQSRIVRMLPKMGKDAVSPLCISLAMNDNEIKQLVIRALGEIGYPQAAPYLLQALEAPDATPELRLMAEEALNSMGYSGLRAASQAFQDLALQYYEDQGSVKADPRVDTANVWYWESGRLDRIEVPTAIYNEIMAMRCSEAALAQDATNEEVIAIWLAANIQREAELGMDVESVESDPAAAADATKDPEYPRSAYFSRAAGTRYCHRVLDLALEHGESAVALGAIEAMRLIAGESSLVGHEDHKQPLAAALTFPDLVVRVKAALALAESRPTTHFAGSQHVISTLAEGLAQSGGMNVVVVDPDEQNLNRVLDVVRAEGANAIGEASLYDALERAREDLPTIGAFFLATDLIEPELGTALATLRANNLYKLTPIIMLSKEGRSERVKLFSGMDDGITAVPGDSAPPELVAAWQAVSAQVGQTQLSGDAALELAVMCADALLELAISQSPVLDFRRAEGALINALRGGAEQLQILAAAVLAFVPSAAAQQAIADVALNPASSESLRVSTFASLAESAKVNGNLLTGSSADTLIDLAINEPNLILRSAASQALGALDLPGAKASQVIMTHRRG